jgi:hypothetical protein
MEEGQAIAGDWQGTIGEDKPGAAPFAFKGAGFDSVAFDVFLILLLWVSHTS